jgi:hypothetical protein
MEGKRRRGGHPMDRVVKPWIDLWDYLDGNFWHICEGGRTRGCV